MSGVADQLAGDGQALPPAAGELVHRLRRRLKPARPRVTAPGRASRPRRARRPAPPVEDLLDRRPRREDGILRHVADADAPRAASACPESALQAGQDLQQRRLARAVRPDEPARSPSNRPKESPSNSGRAPKPLVRIRSSGGSNEASRATSSPSWASSSPCACRCPSPWPHPLSRSDAIIPTGPARSVSKSGARVARHRGRHGLGPCHPTRRDAHEIHHPDLRERDRLQLPH